MEREPQRDKVSLPYLALTCHTYRNYSKDMTDESRDLIKHNIRDLMNADRESRIFIGRMMRMPLPRFNAFYQDLMQHYGEERKIT